MAVKYNCVTTRESTEKIHTAAAAAVSRSRQTHRHQGEAGAGPGLQGRTHQGRGGQGPVTVTGGGSEVDSQHAARLNYALL